MPQTIEQAFYSEATATAAITALVGTRIYPQQAPQDATLPLVIYSEATQQAIRALANNVDLNRYGLHLDCYAESYSDAKAVRNAFKAAFNRFRGTVGDDTLRIRGCYDETGDDGIEAPIHADELGIFRAGLDLTLYYGAA